MSRKRGLRRKSLPSQQESEPWSDAGPSIGHKARPRSPVLRGSGSRGACPGPLHREPTELHKLPWAAQVDSWKEEMATDGSCTSRQMLTAPLAATSLVQMGFAAGGGGGVFESGGVKSFVQKGLAGASFSPELMPAQGQWRSHCLKRSLLPSSFLHLNFLPLRTCTCAPVFCGLSLARTPQDGAKALVGPSLRLLSLLSSKLY